MSNVVKLETERVIQFDRLQELCDFLGKLPSDKFDIRHVITKMDLNNKCGSVCCAIGWFPAIWPESFKWASVNSPNGHAVISSNGLYRNFSCASTHLGLTERETDYLFMPVGEINSDDYTPAIMIARIKKFMSDKREIK